jgi:hypothetical protein
VRAQQQTNESTAEGEVEGVDHGVLMFGCAGVMVRQSHSRSSTGVGSQARAPAV